MCPEISCEYVIRCCILLYSISEWKTSVPSHAFELRTSVNINRLLNIN